MKAESFRTSTNLLWPRWDPEDNTELEVSSGSRFGKILFKVRSVCAERERVSREESRNPETRKAGRVANPEAKRVEGYGMGQGLGNMNKRTYGRRMYDGVLEYKEGVLF